MKINPSQKNIPEGWSLIPAGEVFSFIRTYAFSRDNLVNNTDNFLGIGNIHYGDIHSTYAASSIDLDKVSVPMIKDDSFVPSKDDLLKDGDLIMADASEDYAGVGVTVSLHGIGDKKVVGGLHTFVLRDTKGKTDKRFRQYVFRNPDIRKSLQKVANGVSVYGISKTAVSKMLLPLPPLPEQNRIVAVLETWDQAIQKISQKIEKKKNIKKGLMQKLLTGKTRLPGFKDKWVSSEFNQLFEVLKKPNGLKSDEYQDFGAFSIVDQSKDRLVSGYTDQKDYFYDFTNKPVIIFGDHSRVVKYIDFDTAFGNDGIKLFQAKETLDIKFGYYLLLGFRIPETGYNRHFKYLEMGVFETPIIQEQKTIAGVFTTADKEIQTLERKLRNLQEQKRYLLNNLITGTIRTPETLSV